MVEVVNFKDSQVLEVLVVLEMDLILLNNLKVSLRTLEWMKMMIWAFSLEEMEAKKIATILKEVHLDLVALVHLEVLVMMISSEEEVVHFNHFLHQILEEELQFLLQQQYSINLSLIM